MSRAQKDKQTGWERLATSDRAFSYLANNFPSQMAIAIAIRVEFLLAERWEQIQEDLRRRADPHDWLEISISEMDEIRKLFAATPPDQGNAAAEHRVIDMFSDFAPDRAWWTAQRLRKELVPWSQYRIEQHKAHPVGEEELSYIAKIVYEAAKAAKAVHEAAKAPSTRHASKEFF